MPEPLVITVLQDMTEANRLEQALRESCKRVEQRTRERTQTLRVANEKLQEHNRLQSAFLSIPLAPMRSARL